MKRDKFGRFTSESTEERIKNAWQSYSLWQQQTTAAQVDLSLGERFTKGKRAGELKYKSRPAAIREGQFINDYETFKEIYEQFKGDVRGIKNAVRYQTDYKTFNAFRSVYRELTGETLDRSARSMSTRDLASILENDNHRITTFREQEIARLTLEGYSPQEVKKIAYRLVSEYFFGS